MTKLTAIDLYSGIGGWALGLQLAGIEVVGSYEWWKPAANTHRGNLGAPVTVADIRQLDRTAFPKNVDFVVGSPPCTEFSYANRGGSGDLKEGLLDVAKFLSVVELLKPRFWAMENVPRVAEVIPAAMKDPAGPLYRFKHLAMETHVVDLSDFGLPQARRRCIAGQLPFDLLFSYAQRMPKRTLGDVVAALASPKIVSDPNFGLQLPRSEVTEMETEAPLNSEELRMNREAKEFHPVYNNMAFPDRQEQASRTVTATCTRVSRESIVIAVSERKGGFRRLSIRERACLQGFPITYQFYAKSFAEKAKMIGNAIPPTFTYLLANAMRERTPGRLKALDAVAGSLRVPEAAAPITIPDAEGRSYPATRRFRAALTNLRFKSGVRFELANDFSDEGHLWQVRFFFGASKDIRSIPMGRELQKALRKYLADEDVAAGIENATRALSRTLGNYSPETVQAVWAHVAEGMGPFELADLLAQAADSIHALLEKRWSNSSEQLEDFVEKLAVASQVRKRLDSAGIAKVRRHAFRVLSGLIVGAWFNTTDWHERKLAAA